MAYRTRQQFCSSCEKETDHFRETMSLNWLVLALPFAAFAFFRRPVAALVLLLLVFSFVWSPFRPKRWECVVCWSKKTVYDPVGN